MKVDQFRDEVKEVVRKELDKQGGIFIFRNFVGCAVAWLGITIVPQSVRRILILKVVEWELERLK
jgi:hypothetical protein